MLNKKIDQASLKKMNNSELKELSQEIRDILIKEMLKDGGHLGSNLAIVELTISLLKNFDYKKSKYLFDTGYQSYTYKLLTDRKDFFEKLHKFDGYSIFQEIAEGDPYSGGHTSISAAWAGGYMASNSSDTVIEIIGDGSLATSVGLGGMLNFSPTTDKKGLFILNDNKQGIGINKFNFLNWEQISKGMGFEYYNVKDGHDFDELQKAWDFFNKAKKSVFVHVETTKAKGYSDIKDKRDSVHYYMPQSNEKQNPNFISSGSYVNKLIESKLKNKDTYCITAGLAYAMGFGDFIEKFPKNFIDVGISEEIALVQACALANDGKEVFLIMRPPFFQRCYDQIIHDMVRNTSKVTILLCSPDNIFTLGDSHHGIYDLNMFIAFESIKSYMVNAVNDFESALENAKTHKGTTIIRYPGLLVNDTKKTNVEEWKIIKQSSSDKVLISYTNDVFAIEKYINDNKIDITLINATSLSPVDNKIIEKIKNNDIYTYEPIHGNNTLANKLKNKFPELKIKGFSFKNDYIGKWDIKKILETNKMDLKYIFSQIFK